MCLECKNQDFQTKRNSRTFQKKTKTALLQFSSVSVRGHHCHSKFLESSAPKLLLPFILLLLLFQSQRDFLQPFHLTISIGTNCLQLFRFSNCATSLDGSTLGDSRCSFGYRTPVPLEDFPPEMLFVKNSNRIETDFNVQLRVQGNGDPTEKERRKN